MEADLQDIVGCGDAASFLGLDNTHPYPKVINQILDFLPLKTIHRSRHSSRGGIGFWRPRRISRLSNATGYFTLLQQLCGFP